MKRWENNLRHPSNIPEAYVAALSTPEQALRALVWKRRLGRIWRRVSKAARNPAPRALVLTYHSVGLSERSVPAKNFDAQMRFLKDQAEVVALQELLSGAPSSSGSLTCAVTFDDGYASVYDNAFPILRSLGLTATVYLTTAAIGDNGVRHSSADAGLYPGEPTLTWPLVRELGSGGVTIGSHLSHHKDLTQLSPSQAILELVSSRAAIERRSGSPCRDLSYPWGRTSLQVVTWVRECGYRSAVTARHSPVGSKTNPFAVPRMDIRPEYSLADFKAILDGDWDYLGPAQGLRARASIGSPVFR